MKPSDFKNIEFVNPTHPFTTTGVDRYRMDEEGLWPSAQVFSRLMTRKEVAEQYPDAIFPEYKTYRPKFKIPVYGKRIPRKKKGSFYIVKKKSDRLDFSPFLKGLYEQPKGKLVSYRRESFDLSWMKPVIQKFTIIGKKTTNLIKNLYGRRIRK